MLWKLKKVFYGLKQTPRTTWFDTLSKFLLDSNFVCSLADSSLFICKSKKDALILSVYVDDG